MAEKPQLRAERIKVIYAESHWRVLQDLRHQAIEIIEALKNANINSVIYGSIARGDVTPKSDIDVFIPNPPSSFIIEMILEKRKLPINNRVLVQATPSYAVKGYIEVDERRSVSFPLIKLRRSEREFYKFGGELALIPLKDGKRVPGVDKRLMLIEPTPNGHIESSIIGREEYVASLLGIGTDVVLDRVRALTRRDDVGRTGVFIKRELSPDENFESVLNDIASKNPAVRRRIESVGG